MLITSGFEINGSFVKLPNECGHFLTIRNYLLKSDLHSMNMYTYVYVYINLQWRLWWGIIIKNIYK